MWKSTAHKSAMLVVANNVAGAGDDVDADGDMDVDVNADANRAP